ncbi:pectin lyase-like protein [Obba rivulosa]|uniref:galacturonan 1,4-alpha-galacturonidase n=1 Tax=Obba rivulosa TaxID=1052685 RepID=A0A8E2DKW8_9APHY|nr:pectin lyase-like protein [Obba rivulosa]
MRLKDWSFAAGLLLYAPVVAAATELACNLKPLGHGRDDTPQIEEAIARCGHGGTTVFAAGEYNITRKMTWNLTNSRVDLHGYLNFKKDLPYWMDPDNTYRVIFIQSQASWFVVTGHDFTVDAHNTGGIIGNGQYWWSWYGNGTRIDGDGRPVALTLSNATRGTIVNFRIEGQPFWCNAVADSKDVVYDGMYCNATNADPLYFGQNIVWNTDGIDTFRSDNITMLNWDITLGDDCLAIKGNSTNIFAKNITCRGGTGIAFGSLGQYKNLVDNVENVTIEDVTFHRLDPQIQPIMSHGVYFKSWTGTTIGFPPAEGGGGTGLVTNVTARNFRLDNVTNPIQLYQTNSGHPGDAPSKLQFANLAFEDWSGSAQTNLIVDLECSPAAPCPNMSFQGINVMPPNGQQANFTCSNVVSEHGLPASCTP